MKRRRRIALILLTAALIVLTLCATISVSRYVFDEEKTLSGTYTDFVLSHNGDGQTAIMQEEKAGTTPEQYTYTGYIAVNINNFTDEKISMRDIKFSLREPNAAEIAAGRVVSAWGEVFPLATECTNYEVELVDNKDNPYLNEDGTPVEALKDEYKKLTELAGKAQHTSPVLLKITRKANTTQMPDNDVEHLTIVLETSIPYKDLQVFNITASSALISMGVASSAYQGYSEKIVNVKTSTNFVRPPNVLNSNKNYLAVITLELTGNVILDDYRFQESYDTPLDRIKGNEAGGNETDAKKIKYTLTLRPGADVFLHFYVLGDKYSVKAKAKIDGVDGNEVKISGITDHLVFGAEQPIA